MTRDLEHLRADLSKVELLLNREGREDCAAVCAEARELVLSLMEHGNLPVFLCELAGYVSREECFCEAWHRGGQSGPCLACRARDFAARVEA